MVGHAGGVGGEMIAWISLVLVMIRFEQPNSVEEMAKVFVSWVIVYGGSSMVWFVVSSCYKK